MKSIETYVLLIPVENVDARKICEVTQELPIEWEDDMLNCVNSITAKIRKRIQSEINSLHITVDSFYVYSMNDFMESCNDDELDLGDYFIGYVQVHKTERPHHVWWKH